MEEEVQIHRLKNGLRIAHLESKSAVAYCGVFINAGARDEMNNEWGVAHFTEHMMFKGTTNRRARHIINRLESVGGELNAYTTKEETCVHATFLTEYYERTIELFSDVLLRSVFPVPEINKEREIIIDEINSYLDTPSELIFDDFEEFIIGSNSLGRNTLGSPESVRDTTQEDIKRFVHRNYTPKEMVISSVGNIPFQKLCKWAEKYFGDWNHSSNYKRVPIILTEKLPKKDFVNRNTYQTHCVVGGLAYNLKEKKRLPFSLVCNFLGGPAMNSKLNMVLREKYGYAYHTEASYTPYSDMGIFGIYFGTDNGNYTKCINLINRELKALCTKRLTPAALKKVQQQLIGQTMISAAGEEAQMFSIGKSLLVYNKVTTMKEIYRKIERITSSHVLEVANETLSPDKLSVLLYK
ncbi:putative Zn-dependent peptidase [Balneicella halophila]|uniref:Putative Zn-dependent peptidase n=1 Tax=Balneicella halophila TaxID=1537566 RepID=A0A7L4UNT7_BALHA|nr:pitrilysin family protein [Balneicella halophila]PVX50785.1 putative Zn-dependent peptidase [Balneicella halophila]